MTLHNFVFIFVLISAFLLFFINAKKLINILKIGKEDDRSGKVLERIKRVIVIAFGQTKLLKDPVPGLMHFFIFWGFVILLSAVIESIGEGIYSGFSLVFLGGFYEPLLFLQEFIVLLVITAVLIGFYRRLITKPSRLESHSSLDAYFILSMILFIMLSIYGQNSMKMILNEGHYSSSRFISVLLMPVFININSELHELFYYIFWWIHIGFVLIFLNYLPFSKHLHVLTSIPNVYLSKLNPRGEISPLNLSDETLTKFGASDVEDFTWKQLLDSYTCTECGRCTAACPANITGKPLSPRKIIVETRKRLMEKAPYILKKNKESTNNDPIQNKQLVYDYISEDELWACTTCMACVEECPVMIEHVDSIIEMRRFLVLNESRFPKELQVTFQNLERNFTPWAFSHSSRADWAEGLGVPLVSENPDADILFWIGCAGAYDERAKKVTKALVSIFKKANVNFAILGTEEKCTGDAARRAGNEYLAQMLMNENIATLNKYNIKKIVTACPHCFNTLKNEYSRFGGTYYVEHHAQFIINLIKEGKLNITDKLDASVTYHDSCYLGRYNEIYEAPRDILGHIEGIKQAEMIRNKESGFCCGAGGARMFMEENIGKRVNHERVDEALKLEIDHICTACPFCLTMITDGIKDKDMAEKIIVKDIAEFVVDRIS